MNSKEERTVLDTIEVHAVDTTRKVEGPYECAFVCEERAIYEIGRCAML